MFCRNCGNEMDSNAAICIKCGVTAGVGDKYCHNCGVETTDGTCVCLNCGVSNMKTNNPTLKSRTAAGIFGILLGVFGVHNFYLGYIGKGVAQLLLGLCTAGLVSSIWGLIEGILILTGSINVDGKGNPLRD